MLGADPGHRLATTGRQVDAWGGYATHPKLTIPAHNDGLCDKARGLAVGPPSLSHSSLAPSALCMQLLGAVGGGRRLARVVTFDKAGCR